MLNKKIPISNIEIAYNEFIDEVFELCSNSANLRSAVLTITYTEIELKNLLRQDFIKDECREYLTKLIAFLQKATDRMKYYHTLPPAIPATEKQRPIAIHWTGRDVELVEMIYGLVETKSIDNGDRPIQEIVFHLSSFLGVKIKDCYSTYVDIKRRKNESRTYFLDRMRERLNQRMLQDDERERQRR